MELYINVVLLKFALLESYILDGRHLSHLPVIMWCLNRCENSWSVVNSKARVNNCFKCNYQRHYPLSVSKDLFWIEIYGDVYVDTLLKSNWFVLSIIVKIIIMLTIKSFRYSWPCISFIIILLSCCLVPNNDVNSTTSTIIII